MPCATEERAWLTGVTALVLLAGVGLAQAGVIHQSAPTPGSPPLKQPPWSANLLTGDRASFDHSTGDWAGSPGAKLFHVPVPRQAGAGAVSLMNATTKVGTIYATSGNTAATYLKATPGYRYSFNFWVHGSTEKRDVAGELAFLDVKGQLVAGVFGMKIQEFRTAWVHITDTAAVAPPGARYVLARAVIYKTLPRETHFIDTATLQRAPGGANNVVGPLHTSGNRIIDGTGRPIFLRGLVRMGMQGGPVENLPSAHDIGQAKAWGADVIRLAIGEQKWPGLPQNSCHTDAAYPTKVSNAVNLITGMGIYVILDLHWNTIAACGPANAYPMADCNPGACNATAFWSALATRYKSNPLVGFDLYNEPHGLTDGVWRNGGKVTWHGVTYTAAGMQQMYNAVRSTGATNLVFVTGIDWGNAFPASGPLSGTNIVYSVHSYSCPGNPPPQLHEPGAVRRLVLPAELDRRRPEVSRVRRRVRLAEPVKQPVRTEPHQLRREAALGMDAVHLG